MDTAAEGIYKSTVRTPVPYVSALAECARQLLSHPADGAFRVYIRISRNTIAQETCEYEKGHEAGIEDDTDYTLITATLSTDPSQMEGPDLLSRDGDANSVALMHSANHACASSDNHAYRTIIDDPKVKVLQQMFLSSGLVFSITCMKDKGVTLGITGNAQ